MTLSFWSQCRSGGLTVSSPKLHLGQKRGKSERIEQMDTNRIIRKAGYGGHPRFREIAKFAANFTKLSSIQAPDELEQRLRTPDLL